VINYWVDAAGAFGIEEFIAQRAPGLAQRIRVCTYESLTAELRVTRGAHIFTALDQLTPAGREAIIALYDQLAQHCPGDPLLNDPRRVLGRYRLLMAMHDAGINGFRVRRAGESLDGARFPVFVREETGHDGALTGRLDDSRAVAAALRSLRLRGYRSDNLLVVEFCDVSDAEGKFRMATAFTVGGRIIPAFLLRGTGWMLKWDQSDKDEGAMRELVDHIEGNPHEAWARRVFELAGVDYGRLDYGVKGSTLQVWEINIGPTPGPSRGPAPPPLAPASEALWTRGRVFFAKAMERAFAALDPGISQEQAVIRLAPSLVERMHGESAARRKRQSTLRFLRSIYGHQTIGKPFRVLYSWLAPRR